MLRKLNGRECSALPWSKSELIPANDVRNGLIPEQVLVDCSFDVAFADLVVMLNGDFGTVSRPVAESVDRDRSNQIGKHDARSECMNLDHSGSPAAVARRKNAPLNY